MNKYHRRLIFACAAVYVAAYIGRLSYMASMVGILSATGVTKAEAGTVSTFFYFTYGCGQLINAFLCRRYKPRPVIACVLGVSALSNLLILFCHDVAVMKYIWLVNGAAQSMLWCTLIELLSRRIPRDHLTKATLAMSATVSIGTISAYGISALCTGFGQVFLTFGIAGGVLLLMIPVWLFCTAQLSSMPVVTVGDAKEPEKSPSFIKVFAAMGALILLTGVVAIGNGFLKDTMTTWVPTLLYDAFSVPEEYSIIITLILPLLSLCGATIVVTVRRVIRSYNQIMGLLFFGAALGFCGVLLSYHLHSIIPVIVCFAVNACLMSAVNNIVTFMIPMDQPHSAGMFAGIMDAFCYVGSTLSGIVPGAVIDAGGFGTLLIILPCAALFFSGFAFISGIRRGEKRKKHS